MARGELIPLDNREAWAKALSGIPHAFQHTAEYSHAMRLTSGYETFLYSFRDGATRLACPLVERDFRGYVDVATPSGLSGFVGTGSWADCACDWDELARERGWVTAYVGLHPMFEPPGFGPATHNGNSIYVLRIDRGRDELLRRMDRNRRRELRGWDIRARDFVHDRAAISEFLVGSYGPFMKAIGARDPHLSPRTLDSLCRSELCLVVGAEHGGRLNAVFLFGKTAFGGESVISVATPEGRAHTTDLLWYGIMTLMAQGIPLLNLGGGVSEGDDIAKAKQRLRPERLPLRSLRQTFRNDTYDELCRLAGVDSGAVQSYFPAYRAPGRAGMNSAPD